MRRSPLTDLSNFQDIPLNEKKQNVILYLQYAILYVRKKVIYENTSAHFCKRNTGRINQKLERLVT